MVLTGTLKLRNRVSEHAPDPAESARRCAGMQPPPALPHTAGHFAAPAPVYASSYCTALFESTHCDIIPFLKKRKKTVIDKIYTACKALLVFTTMHGAFFAQACRDSRSSNGKFLYKNTRTVIPRTRGTRGRYMPFQCRERSYYI